jgi:hypothetical protein
MNMMSIPDLIAAIRKGGRYTWMAEIRALCDEIDRLRELTKGPHYAEKCRNHWHVYNSGFELMGSIMDEETATIEAERMNAEWNVSKEKIMTEIQSLREENKKLRVKSGEVNANSDNGV